MATKTQFSILSFNRVSSLLKSLLKQELIYTERNEEGTEPNGNLLWNDFSFSFPVPLLSGTFFDFSMEG